MVKWSDRERERQREERGERGEERDWGVEGEGYNMLLVEIMLMYIS